VPAAAPPRGVHEIIGAVTVGERVLVGGVTAIVLIGGPLYLWWDMSRWEYLNERVAVCTITKVVHSDEEQNGYVDTAQCGRLGFKPYRFDLEYDLESGHTYRLRVAEIEPQHGPDITAVMAVEGDAGAP
jgi:hypothetical protein